jgi:3-oxoacyl-[acyl-carrier protein] reductase|tara:strand:+ start:1264 stop:2028 length:765 start_codon:yes stop_codon:yes gene_type:complete
MLVDKKVAVITGAARGVGRATALKLANAGCHIVINYRSSKEQALQTVKAIEACGVRALAIQGDICDDRFCRELMETAFTEFGRLDILVNNAGTTAFIPHDDLDQVQAGHWENLFSTNVKAVFQCTRAARPWMEKNGDGEIVNVGSIAGIRGTGSSIPYSASKGATHTLTLSLARVLGPHIRMNAIAPAFIAGEWLEEGLGESFEAAKKVCENSAILGKVCQPKDVADAIVSLITGSDLVTGQILVCDGGALLAE